MQCTKPIKIRNGVFPCGRCLHCRISKAREWSVRLLQELSYWDSAVFVTLTYEDKYLPSHGSLKKSDLQKFFKRLRKSLPARKIKYFACGEYGDKNKRPHYHAIIFGLGQTEQDKSIIKNAWRFCQWSNFQDKKAFGSVTYDSCRYVSDYIHKKYSGVKADEEYISKGLEVPFKVCSTGLGLRFALDNAENLRFYRSMRSRGVNMALPRYYVQKLGLELEQQDDKRFRQWTRYAQQNGIQPQDVAEEILAHARQREETAARRLKLFRKGDL